MERRVQKKDPTEDVMAAIARIVENPTARRAPAAPDPVPASAGRQALSATSDDALQPTGAHGYSRLGPGPLPALRFKWTARRDAAGDYYVDETIGDYSRPVTTGPLATEEAVALVDTRVKEARERFDRLKAEISVRGPEPDADTGAEPIDPAGPRSP